MMGAATCFLRGEDARHPDAVVLVGNAQALLSGLGLALEQDLRALLHDVGDAQDDAVGTLLGGVGAHGLRGSRRSCRVRGSCRCIEKRTMHHPHGMLSFSFISTPRSGTLHKEQKPHHLTT